VSVHFTPKVSTARKEGAAGHSVLGERIERTILYVISDNYE
jgi:hypothetical protein